VHQPIVSGPAPSQKFSDPRAAEPVVQSDTLFLGRQEIVIRHDGQDYRLRVTRQNKLILIK
jgi:hemin uptake protein HemP